MKTWRWMMALVAGGALIVACTTETKSSDDDDDNNTGGSGTGGNTTTSSTSSSTTSSTNTPCPTNLTIPSDATCDACFKDQCCDEALACENDADCANLLNCYSACTDSACIDQCDADHPTGAALNDAIDTCLDTNCATECPQSYAICDSGFAMGDEACATCLGDGADGTPNTADDCCTELTACYNDTNCQSCLIDQSQTACDAGTLDEDVNTCWDNNCTSACGG